MKKSMFLIGAVLAAGLLTTACSSDENSSPEQSIANKFDAQGNAYVNIAINTPSTRATRANEVYDDGIAAEYDVKDAVLVLFKGTNANEDAATFVSASTMDNHVAQGSNNIRISDKILFTQQINKGTANFAGTDGLLAFLVVNHNGKFDVADDHSLKINNNAFSGTFADLKGLTLNVIGNTTTGLLMTNAPMSSKPGKTASPADAGITWLTEIKATDIYNSEADAYNGSAFVDIFVERAAAKVDVTASAASGTLIDGSVTYNKNGIKWSIENYNTAYYIERHLNNSYFGSSSENLGTGVYNYRFADSQPVEAGFTLYRTYWAEDPNMSGTPEITSTIKLTQPDVSGWNGITGVQYIAENTVDQNSLKQGNTTRVVLAVPFNNGTDFYTTSWAGADVIISEGDIKESIKTFVKSLASFTSWQTDPSYDITDVTIKRNTDGSASIESLSVSTGAPDITSVVTDANSKSQMSYFKGGIAYYKVLIKHFGDDETPLPATVSGTGYTDIYGSVEADRIRDFLGRYSVVRNNWYNIDLAGIKHIGKPSVPDIPTDTPDDEIDSYLKVRINVLSWAKRTQQVTL